MNITQAFPYIAALALVANLSGTALSQAFTFEGCSFNPLPGTFYRDVRVTDLNGDGISDVVTTSNQGGANNKTSIFPRQADGSFLPRIDLLYGSDHLAVADFDGDGLIDILTVAGCDLRISHNEGQWGFQDHLVQVSTFCAPYNLQTVDVDHDGDVDIVYTYFQGIGVLMNNGTGQTWTEISHACQSTGSGLRVADIDANGWEDILTTTSTQGIIALFNSGAGVFGPPQSIVSNLPAQLEDILSGDWNEDGVMDLAGAGTQYMFLFLGSPAGTFTLSDQATIGFGGSGNRHLEAADMNGDSHLDFICSDLQSMCMVRGGAGTGLFSGVNYLSSSSCATGYALPFDANGDQKPDLLCPTGNCGLAICLNSSGPKVIAVQPDHGPGAGGTLATISTADFPNGFTTLHLEGVSYPCFVSNNQAVINMPVAQVLSSQDYWVDIGLDAVDFGSTHTEVLNDCFRYVVPKISATIPPSAPFDQQTSVTFTVYDNAIVSGVGTATFGSAAPTPATAFFSGGQTHIVTTAPAQSAPGPVSVTIRIGSETTFADRGFVYLGPSISSISPITGFQAGGDLVTFGLYDFQPGAIVDAYFGAAHTSGIPQGSLTSSTMQVITPSSLVAGVVDIELVQFAGMPNEKEVLSPGAWEYVGAHIHDLSVTSGPLEGGTPVVASTDGFQPGVPATVALGGQNLIGTVQGSPPNQTVSFVTKLANASGPATVSITQGILYASLPDGYSFDSPRVIEYCTPKHTSTGSIPIIGWTGSPCLFTNDFNLTLTGALPHKNALHFRGTTSSNFPLFGGTLCVGGQIKRGPVMLTDLSGNLIDPLAVNPAWVGVTFYYQFWFRDPADPFTAGLSDGLQVTFYN